MIKKILLSVIALMVLASNLFSEEMDNFFIPFSSYNDKWDHRWSTLLPNSEQYESIEILSFDNKDFPNSLYVLVKLNWKYEPKQTLYFNNAHKAKSWHYDAKFADMVYSKEGEPGNPMGLSLSFTDELDNNIEVSFSCDESKFLGDGYLDATNNYMQEVFSFVAYENHSVPDYVSVKIADTLIVYDNLKNSNEFWKYKPSYSFNNYQFAIRAMERYVNFKANEVDDTFGDNFDIKKDSTGYTLRTKNIGFKKFIEIKADTLKQVKDYIYHNSGDQIKISFEPAIHSSLTPSEKEQEVVKKNKFTISASNVKESIIGESLSVLKYAYIHTEWFLLKPEWAYSHSFASDLVMLDKNAYKIMILPISPK
jgi:5'(3')-deoxyribonucleotidase